MTKPGHEWIANGVSQSRVADIIRHTIQTRAMQMAPGQRFAFTGWHWINWGFRTVCVKGWVSPGNVVYVADAWIVTKGC